MDDLTALMSFLRKHPSMSSATVAERRAAYDGGYPCGTGDGEFICPSRCSGRLMDMDYERLRHRRLPPAVDPAHLSGSGFSHGRCRNRS